MKKFAALAAATLTAIGGSALATAPTASAAGCSGKLIVHQAIKAKTGAVVGYLEHLDDARLPFRAKRMNPDRRGFTALGDFDDFEGAFDALRW